MSKDNYRINGRIKSSRTGGGIEGLRVEGWDKDLIFDDLIGETRTDSNGCFRLEFDRSKFRELFLDRKPDLFFKIYRGDELIQSTEDSVLWNLDTGETELTIEVDLPGSDKKGAYSVLVTASQPDGRALAGILITAFDIDVRVETPLGSGTTDEEGCCEIGYTQGQLSRPDKEQADLLVRASTAEGELLWESETIFNAGNDEKIEFSAELPEQPVRSEYENLQRTLAPLLGDLSPADLAPRDIDYLLKKHQDQPLVDQRRLGILAAGSGIARDSGLSAEFIYGLAQSLTLQLPLSLDALLQQSESDIREGLTRAIDEGIVSARIGEAIDDHLGRIDHLRLDRGLLVRREITLRVVNAESGKALRDYRVHAVHARSDGEPRALGYDLTDHRGRCTFSIVNKPVTDSAEAAETSDKLNLKVFDPSREEIHAAVIPIDDNQARVIDIEVPADRLPRPPIHPISSVTAALEMDLPGELRGFLVDNGIHTIEDIRHRGGLHRLTNLPVAADHEAVRALEAQANLSLLSDDPREREVLFNNGLPSISAVASKPFKSLLTAVGGELGPQKTAHLLTKSKAQKRLLDSILTEVREDYAAGNRPAVLLPFEEREHDGDEVLDDDELRQLLDPQCTCRDCEAAVSPAAYLADLLDYTVEHVKNGPGPDDFITLEELANLLGQPFGDLPVNCEAVTRQVRQVRIAIEVLRRFVDAPPQRQEQAYRFSAYTALLRRIGTSYEELRLARTADDDTRRALAARLGIGQTSGGQDLLDALLLEPATLAEASLESLFGLVDTDRDPLTDGPVLGDQQRQIRRWRLAGVEWGWNTDRNGFVHVQIGRYPEGYRVALFRDDQWQELVATGMIDTPEGTLTLSPRGQSNLSGVIELAYEADDDDIRLRAVPELLCWRLAHLREFWQGQDGAFDRYSATPAAPLRESDLLPVIDPDLIGPDDFRCPFPNTGPFDLWLERRAEIDGKIEEFRTRREELASEETGPFNLPLSQSQILTRILDEELGSRDEILVWTDRSNSLLPNAPIDEVVRVLRGNLMDGRDVEITEQEIESKLRLKVDPFLRLGELLEQAEGEDGELAEEEWDEIGNILVQRWKTDQFADWRAEELLLEADLKEPLFGPKHFWCSLREPVEGPWPIRTSDTEPLIDPDIQALKDLPEPTAGQRAIVVWTSRQADIQDLRDLLESKRSSNGFSAMLTTALGEPDPQEDWAGDGWAAHLSDLLALSRPGAASGGAVDAQAIGDELDALKLTPDDLRLLVEIGSVENPADEDWQAVYDILTVCLKHREGLAAQWRTQELTDPVLGNGSWYARKARLPKWRASAEERQSWRLALECRSRLPHIDPDLIGGDNYIRNLLSGPAAEILGWRRTWINAQLNQLRILREAMPSPALSFENLLIERLFDETTLTALQSQYGAIHAVRGINALTTHAFGVTSTDLDTLSTGIESGDEPRVSAATRNVNQQLGICVERFQRVMDAIHGAVLEGSGLRTLVHAALLTSIQRLVTDAAQGSDTAARLEQLGLTRAAFARLIRLRDLLYAGQVLEEAEWDEVYSILLQVRKGRSCAEWLADEQQHGVYLGAEHFQIPAPVPLTFPPPERPPLPAWRATERDLRRWRETLKVRNEQAATTISALQKAVSTVEEETLPALRDALVMAADVEGGNLTAKAKRLTDLTLTDMQSSGCQQTTRISQAIESVSGVLESIRDGLLQDTYPDMSLDAEHFDEEWKWLGSYPPWRAAMFVHLYPENILLPSLRKEQQTPAFLKLVSDLRKSRSLTAQDACVAAREYADYFEDVCTMEVQATCYGETRIHKADGCAQHATPNTKSLFYMFGKGGKTGKVYWSALDPADTAGYPQTYWEAVPALEEVRVEKIIGTVPCTVPTTKQRFIVVFYLAREAGKTRLLLHKYDLDIGGQKGWARESPDELGLPDGRDIHRILAVQSSFIEEPPILALHLNFPGQSNTDDCPLPPDYICLRSLNKDARGWRGDDTTNQSTDTDDEEDWSTYQVWAYPAGEVYSVIKCHLGDETSWLVYGKRREATIVSETFDPALPGTNLRVCSYEDRDTNLATPHVSGRPFIRDTIPDQPLGSRSYLGAFPISPTHWCVYFEEEDGRITQDSSDAEGGVRFNIDPIPCLETIVPHYGGGISQGVNCMVLHYQGLFDRYFKVVDYRWLDGLLNIRTSGAAHPKLPRHQSNWPRLFDLFAGSSYEELQNQRSIVIYAFRDNSGESQTIQNYLEEAYYFVPVHLALQLQRHGNFTTALDWFRTVYDYRAPTNRRNISYMLGREVSEEETFDWSERTADWLLDPLNPHRIAANRRKTYTRFTLQALVRCFLEYADSEFTRDTAESVPRARDLYTMALELLDDDALSQQSITSCEESFILGIGRDVETTSVEYGVINQIVANLLAIGSTVGVSPYVKIIAALTNIASFEQPLLTRLIAMLDVVGKVQLGSWLVMSDLGNRRERLDQVHSALLRYEGVAEAAKDVAGMVDKGLGASTTIGESLPGEEPPDESDELPNPVVISTPAPVVYAYQPTVNLKVCIPPNPVLSALRLKAELNLYKIRWCRNIAGMERQLDPYAAPTDTVSGLPQIGEGGQLVLPGMVNLQPTPYRYQVLIERSKQLAQMAAQFEAAMLASLEKRDAEYYQRLKADQELELTRQGVRLQQLRVTEAEDGLDLAELQRDRAQILIDVYEEWIHAGLNEYEWDMIEGYQSAKDWRIWSTGANAVARAAQIWMSAGKMSGSDYALGAIATAAIGVEAYSTGSAIKAETYAQVASIWASFERRKDEWELQKKVAEQDVKIGDQQIRLAEDHVRIVGQEHRIAEMQADHAKEVVDFLTTKFTNVELYDWMSDVLEGVYSFFLQQATAMARLTESQVAFERQQIPPSYIQADYWEAPGDMALATGGESDGPDRRGLTGSARLLEDIHQLDLYAFKTDQRKLQLRKTLSLAHLVPDAFERLRKDGVMLFQTPMALFDHDFPGHYLRLIKRVSTSVLALVPPTEGIHATLSTTGLSRVVIGNDGLYQQIDVRRYPESVALTSPVNATGLFELQPENPDMLLPFEAMGVDTFWEFRMPKAANRFDYRTLMDVLITIDYTALDDFAYRQQVIRELDSSVSGDLPLSFRHDLPDQWYGLHHSDPTDTSIVVRFETRRTDFPPNIEDLGIQHLLLCFVQADGTALEMPKVALSFTAEGETSPIGGGASPVEGIISTRSANAGSWLPMTGKPPFGQWELALPNSADMQKRFKNGEIENVLFVITYRGTTPPWPQ